MLHFAPHALHHNAINSHMPFHPLDYVYAEPEPKVQAKQAQVEEFTNLALDQGKPWCI
jgi:endonuclease/exonuclease/phosphatase family metal-dependent hydrolase